MASRLQPLAPKPEGKLDAAECTTCKAPIYWVTLESGKRMPVDRGADLRVVVDTEGVGRVTRCYKSHFASCAQASAHRRPR